MRFTSGWTDCSLRRLSFLPGLCWIGFSLLRQSRLFTLGRRRLSAVWLFPKVVWAGGMFLKNNAVLVFQGRVFANIGRSRFRVRVFAGCLTCRIENTIIYVLYVCNTRYFRYIIYLYLILRKIANWMSKNCQKLDFFFFNWQKLSFFSTKLPMAILLKKCH